MADLCRDCEDRMCKHQGSVHLRGKDCFVKVGQSPQAEQATASCLSELLCVIDGEERPYGVEYDCYECDFCIEADAGGAIGAQIGSRGTYKYCEKGYWKEDT